MAEKKTETPAPQASESKAGAVKESALTKMEAVRRAINALGDAAGRADLQKYIQSNFKIDMTLDHISNYKGEIGRRAKKGRGKPGRPKMKKAKAVAAATPGAAKAAATKPVAKPAPTAVVKGENVSLKAIEKARDLLGLLNPAEAKKLIDVLTD